MPSRRLTTAAVPDEGTPKWRRTSRPHRSTLIRWPRPRSRSTEVIGDSLVWGFALYVVVRRQAEVSTPPPRLPTSQSRTPRPRQLLPSRLLPSRLLPSRLLPEPAASKPAAKPKAVASQVNKPVRDGKFEFTVKNVKCGISKVGNEYLSTKAQGQFCAVQLHHREHGRRAAVQVLGQPEGLRREERGVIRRQ